ncbi:MAG: hypothetical protein LBI45_07310 [Bacteroidales bacterium]|nr:hypothetical protein [Bacteroidales bacterium]
MATVTLHYNTRNRMAVQTLNYLLTLGIFRMEEKLPTHSFKKSMSELQSGKTLKLKNTKNPLEEILQ